MDTPVLVSKSAPIEPKPKSAPGLKFERRFTKPGVNPLDSIEWIIKDAVIKGFSGKEKFRQNNVEVPATWEDNTVGIVAEKYFRVVNGVKERSAKQMFSRVALWITEQGVNQGIFFDLEARQTFHNELLYLLVHGMYAFNSPVWFNAGVGPTAQCSACFIQSVEDNMESIMELARNEVMLFKGGSGTGSNLSPLRSSWETLTGGGFASGPVSFMKGFDAFAGVTKSGGTTRRAAKMVALNIDHPDILEQQNGMPGFIACKADAEMQAVKLMEGGYSAEFNVAGNAYDRTGFQNANHSVRVSDAFMEAVERDGMWSTILRNGEVHRHYAAQKLFTAMAEAAWVCGDPGIQFDTQTNRWHTSPNSGRINASNPCSEYLFLDDTACNLGSINLLKFATNEGFDVKGFEQAVDITITAKEIIVQASSYPTATITENSHKYRTLGLGYTNLGALLTFWGLPYDSDEGRKVTGAITSLMGGRAYAQSANLASTMGPFSEYEVNKTAMLTVIHKHKEASVAAFPLENPDRFGKLFYEAINVWDTALHLGKLYGYRNAQTTVLAPTGTISFLMGADTTGIEPMLGVVTTKKAVGEGFLTIPNNVVKPALENLGYGSEDVKLILKHITDHRTIHDCPQFKKEHGPIFAEALGDFALCPEAHVDMMAAAQPFLSGGISKTVNMPKKATVQDIADIYMRAWKKGLKCIAIYRDGCKGSQPISVKEKKKDQPIYWGTKRRLADTRLSKTHKFRVGDTKGYLTVGQYPDGKVGEIFIRVSKQGSFVAGMIESFAQSFSTALQHGTPLDDLVEKFKGVRFEPSGFTGHPNITVAKSILDYVARWLEMEYLAVSPPEEATPEIAVARTKSSPIKVVDLSGDPCRSCGGITRRTGSCYTCTGCGDTTGCG